MECVEMGLKRLADGQLELRGSWLGSSGISIKSIISSMCQNEENIYANLTINRRSRTPHSRLPPAEQTRSREAPVLRTPVMGLKAEARRLSYIKKKRLRRSQSSISRRSIHRKKRSWFARKPQTAPRFPEPPPEETGRNTGAKWARTIINRLSFNKLFRKHS
ncbi:hypothetical protein Y032_0158g3235 [Ancylostoma ceylanicum]|uniref:Uncharacterized protein n=1 Tax=Ancylostoma ceylanicum TaxID=53326 RepID=A0A016SZ41_9BILA|nr:hypothetical protein Y032_0158g3235 [Ancylostoma ceylanicum]